MQSLIVVPNFNEFLNVEPILRTLPEVTPEANVLLVDDGSPDGTAARVCELASELGHIEVLHRADESGLCGAYRTGFEWGIDRGYEHFVGIDCNVSDDPDTLSSILEAVETNDIVIESRYIEGGSVQKWSFLQLLNSRSCNYYLLKILGLGVAGSTAGFRGYTSKALEVIDFQTVGANGYCFQIEMRYRAKCGDAPIVETPIEFTGRRLGASKMSCAIVIEALLLATLLKVSQFAENWQRGLRR